MLINIHFKIVTDCQALMFLSTQKTKNPQIIRWTNLLSEFNFDIKHRTGEKIAHVDALSRAPTEPEEEECVSEDRLRGIFSIMNVDDEIIMYQYSYPILKRKREILLKPINKRTNNEKNDVRDYICESGILYKREGKNCYT